MQISTFANGAGQWRAQVTFDFPLSESDPRSEFNLGVQWANIRRRARKDILRAITEREQNGRNVFRVRVGPFQNRDAADRIKARLDDNGFDAALVRVQK